MKRIILGCLISAVAVAGGSPEADVLKGGGGLPLSKPSDFMTAFNSWGEPTVYSPGDSRATSSLGSMLIKAEAPYYNNVFDSSYVSSYGDGFLDSFSRAYNNAYLGSNSATDQNLGLSYLNDGSLAAWIRGGEYAPKNAWMGDPVDMVSGAFAVDEVDLTLPGPFPLEIRRNYNSQSAGFGEFGYSWKSSMVPYILEKEGTLEKVIIAAELDGTTVEYVQVGASNSKIFSASESYTVADGKILSNGHLSNNTSRGTGGMYNLFRQTIMIESSQADPDPRVGGPVATDKYTLNGSDGSKRYYYKRDFPLSSSITRSRPYLYQWIDNVGNYLTFHYGNNKGAWDFGQLIQIRSSNGSFLNFEYDSQGHVTSIYTNDGRKIRYEYDGSGDLVKVIRPDQSSIEYRYLPSDKDPETNATVDWYSTHLLTDLIKPDGRALRNKYDKRRRVVMQWATAGKGLELVRNAIFVYGAGVEADGVVDPETDVFDTGMSGVVATHPRATDNLTGWTRAYDWRNAPTQNAPQNDVPGVATYSPSNPGQLGTNHYLYEYDKGLITRTVDLAGRETLQEWYTSREVYPDPAAAIGSNGEIAAVGPVVAAPSAPAGYSRSLKRSKDSRGLVSYMWYDSNGNKVLEKKYGDFSGDGVPETRVASSIYNELHLPLESSSEVYQSDGSAVTVTTKVSYDSFYKYLPSVSSRWVGGVEQMRAVMTYKQAPGPPSPPVAAHLRAPFAVGLLETSINAEGGSEASGARHFYDNRGFLVRSLRFARTGLATVPEAVENDADEKIDFFYNSRAELVRAANQSGASTFSEFDAMGRPTIVQVRDGNTLMSTSTNYYNGNGEVSWVDGPRSGPEDYILRDYDADGRVIAEIVWRSEAKMDGSGVVSAANQDWFLGQSITRHEYDINGNRVRSIDPLGNETVMSYDEADRLLTTTAYQGEEGGIVLASENRTYWPGSGDLKSVTDSGGRTTTFNYNVAGHPIRKDNPDGTVEITSYYPDGRMRSVSQEAASGAEIKKVTQLYDENSTNGGRKVTKVLESAGVAQGSEISLTDRRGNVVSSTNLDGYTTVAAFDGLGRNVLTTGPPGQAGFSLQQSVSTEYNLLLRTTKVTNAIGDSTLTKVDALGRSLETVSTSTLSTHVTRSSSVYSSDFHSVEQISGVPGEGGTRSVTFTDASGRPVLTRKYREDNTFDHTITSYDVAGNAVAMTDELGQVTRTSYDALKRPLSVLHPDGAETRLAYDRLGNVTDKFMPRGLHWQAGYDFLGRKEWEKLIGRDQGVSRHFSYSYHANGILAGLPSSQVDLSRGIITEFTAYDDLFRVKTTKSRSSLPQVVGVQKDFSYDKRGNLLSQEEAHMAGDHPPTRINRQYDGYGQVLSETILVNGQSHSVMTQKWDAGGRRVEVAPDGAVHPFTFGYDPEGRINEVAYGPDYKALIKRTAAGLLESCSSPWLETTVTSRDQSGRVLSKKHVLGQNLDGAYIAGSGPDSMVDEKFTYRKDHKLASRTLERSVLNDTATYEYDAKGRLIHWDLKRTNSAQQVLFSKPFDLAYDAERLGALMKRDILRNEQDTERWQIPGGRLDQYGRVLSQHLGGMTGFVAEGTLNLMAKVDLNVTRQEDGRKYSYENVDVRSKQPVDGTYQWNSELSLPSGSYQLEATAHHPSGGASRTATSHFTVSNDTLKSIESEYDASGYPSRRFFGDGRVQSFTWDVLGRLLSVRELNGGDGYQWNAIYDAYSRRISTAYQALGTGPAVGGGERHLVTKSYFDPSYEFLELGGRWNGITAEGAPFDHGPVWKLHGPDLNGHYGSFNGIGGVLGTIADDNTDPNSRSMGYLTDHLGDVVATIGKNTSAGGLVFEWTGMSDPYGPAKDVVSSSLAQGIVSLSWKSRAQDPTGFIWLGKRYYQPDSARFLSPDPAGHDGSWDLYMYAGGDPINFLDPDGRMSVGWEPSWDPGDAAVNPFLAEYNRTVNAMSDAMMARTCIDCHWNPDIMELGLMPYNQDWFQRDDFERVAKNTAWSAAAGTAVAVGIVAAPVAYGYVLANAVSATAWTETLIVTGAGFAGYDGYPNGSGVADEAGRYLDDVLGSADNLSPYVDDVSRYADDVVENGKVTPSELARSWQGSGDYPGVDIYRDITIKKGTIIYGGDPGQSPYYTTLSAIRRVGDSASELFQGLQVGAHPTYGYRPAVTAYEVIEDVPAAFGRALENTQHGSGGLPQIFLPDWKTSLRPIHTAPLSP